MTMADVITRRQGRRSHFLYTFVRDNMQRAEAERAELRNEAVELRSTGATYRAIAAEIGVSASLVRTLLREADLSKLNIY